MFALATSWVYGRSTKKRLIVEPSALQGFSGWFAFSLNLAGPFDIVGGKALEYSNSWLTLHALLPLSSTLTAVLADISRDATLLQSAKSVLLHLAQS